MARPNRNQGGKKGGGKNKNRNRFYNRATNNVELQDQSQVNLLNQQLQQAQQDYLREQQAAMSIYGGAGEEIRDLPRPEFGQIGDQYTQALSSIAPLFAGEGGMPASETAAGNALGLAYGESGHTMLANQAAREGMARSSAAREANLSERYARDALVQRLEDTLQSYNDQLGQVRADDPWQIKQEVQTLRDQAMEQRLLKQKMQSDRAFSEWLQGYVGGMGSSGRPGRPGPGGGGGGGADPGRPGPADNGAYNVNDPLDIHTGHQVRGGGGGGGGGAGYAPTTNPFTPTPGTQATQQPWSPTRVESRVGSAMAPNGPLSNVLHGDRHYTYYLHNDPAQYRAMAETLRNAGYQRPRKTLSRVGNFYDLDPVRPPFGR